MTTLSRSPIARGLSRRSTLLGLGSAVTLAGVGGPASLALASAPTDQRFVVVLLRGALDGMSAVVPYGDPALVSLRAPLVPPAPGQPDGMSDLGGFFGLHPALSGVHGLYGSGDALIVHAVAGPNRSRSHFEAQDSLESGADHRLSSGWLNRAVQAMGTRSTAAASNALAIGVTVPLLLRGPAPVANWAPETGGLPSDDLYARVLAMHAGDRLTAPALAEGIRERGFSATVLADDPMQADPKRPMLGAAFPALAGAAGRMLAAADGPRVAALEVGGWDTHAAQKNRLHAALEQLDKGLVALKDGLGAAWGRTVVLVVTEFGRTARINGTGGTDHGTATVAFVVGGAVAGGHVRGDWPGLGAGRLLADRDLAPTSDVRAVAKGLLAGHLGLSGNAVAAVFPDSAGVSPMSGLLRARA